MIERAVSSVRDVTGTINLRWSQHGFARRDVRGVDNDMTLSAETCPCFDPIFQTFVVNRCSREELE